MEVNKLIKGLQNFAKPFCVTDGDKFRLKDIDPGDTLGYGSDDKPGSKEVLTRGIEALAQLQDKLYAQDKLGGAAHLPGHGRRRQGRRHQARHVRRQPAGLPGLSFKSPSAEELDHDYLWRCMKSLPERGRIGIFNRSYYEETLVVRVHPEFLAAQKIPPRLVTKRIWKKRFEDIRNFETYLTRNGVLVRKFFLHVSKKEQKRRFLERLENPEKNWKFSRRRHQGAGLLGRVHGGLRGHDPPHRHERSAVVRCARRQQVVPRMVVAAAVVETLDSMDLSYPKVSKEKLKELAAAKQALLGGQS